MAMKSVTAQKSLYGLCEGSSNKGEKMMSRSGYRNKLGEDYSVEQNEHGWLHTRKEPEEVHVLKHVCAG